MGFPNRLIMSHYIYYMYFIVTENETFFMICYENHKKDTVERNHSIPFIDNNEVSPV